MPAGISSLVPLAHVRDVDASIAFYRHLGFAVRNTYVPDGAPAPVWAWLAAADAHLMISAASAPIDPTQQAVLFYVYCDDVPGMRQRLLTAGIEAGPIAYPFYSPRGEFRIADPDGYVVIVAHA